MSISNINPSITIDYLKNTKENLYFDRKRAKISNQDLVNEIASFANANGGVVALGITDVGIIEGFNPYGINKLNECQKVVTNYLRPTPNYSVELIKIKNLKKRRRCNCIISYGRLCPQPNRSKTIKKANLLLK